MRITGNFETHLTVTACDGGPVPADFAAEAGLKVSHIVLDCGREPSQFMLTRHSAGTLEQALAAAERLSTQLVNQRVKVCRCKIEIEAGNPAAPADSNQAAARPAQWYFEHHVKLLLPADTAPLEQISPKHSAHISRNAFRLRPDAMTERFLTQRFYRTGRDTAQAALANLVQDLLRNGFVILEQEAEYVVFDSNVALDAGWLDAPLIL